MFIQEVRWYLALAIHHHQEVDIQVHVIEDGMDAKKTRGKALRKSVEQKLKTHIAQLKKQKPNER